MKSKFNGNLFDLGNEFDSPKLNATTDVDRDWQKFIKKQKGEHLSAIIAEEKLKPGETEKFINNAFRDGVLKTTGTDIDKILPPVSRFGGGGRAEKKQDVIGKLLKFFEKYLGLVNQETSSECQDSKKVAEKSSEYNGE